ncbi:UNVERIFIED_CONTAM: hypothetical protein GTU68_037014 [Idotea baltica]|nr:hypothetical protein [Idotea baltica]
MISWLCWIRSRTRTMSVLLFVQPVHWVLALWLQHCEMRPMKQGFLRKRHQGLLNTSLTFRSRIWHAPLKRCRRCISVQ